MVVDDTPVLRIFGKLDEIEKEGCSIGKQHAIEVAEIKRRTSELETKFNWIIVLLITNLSTTIVGLLQSRVFR